MSMITIVKFRIIALRVMQAIYILLASAAACMTGIIIVACRYESPTWWALLGLAIVLAILYGCYSHTTETLRRAVKRYRKLMKHANK